MTKKKKLFFISMIFLIIFALFGSFQTYRLYRTIYPDIQLYVSSSSNGEDEHSFEFVSGVWSGSFNVPMAKSKAENLAKFTSAIEEVTVELYNYIAPTLVTVSGKVKDGQTIIQYNGTITTKDGLTKEYSKTLIFDFILGSTKKF